MEASSAEPTLGPDPQPGPRSRLCSSEDKTPGPVAARHPRTGDRQPQGPEVAARTEPASRPRTPPRKPRRTPLPPPEPFRPDTMGGLAAQDGRLDGSDHKGDGARRGGPRRPWLPAASGLESWHRPCPPPGGATGRKRTELREDVGASAGPRGHTPPRAGHLTPRRDSPSPTPGDHWGPRLAHSGGPPGAGAGPRSLSEQVEKNRLFLREMLRGRGAAPLNPGPPGGDRRPAGDVDGALDRTRASGCPPEQPPHRPGQDKQPPPPARVKARTQPLRASHDIVPTRAPDSRSLTPAPPPSPQEQEAADPPWAPSARPVPDPPPAACPLLPTSCKNRRPGGRTEPDPHGPKPPLAPEGPGHGPGCGQDAGGDPRQAGSAPGQPPAPRRAPGDPAGPSPPAAAPWDPGPRSGGRGGFAPGRRLKKIFSALGQAARPLAARTRSHSEEQLRPPAPGPGAPAARRAPSLQLLHLVSSSPQRGKSTSFHSLQALLSGRRDRASLYLVQEPAGDGAAGRPPRPALSVEDVGAPRRARAVGRVVAAFPDGTSQLQLQCSPGGGFGFCVAAGSGRRDSGLYVRAMADVGTAKLYSGLLAEGDEVLEVDGAKVAALGAAHVQELLAHADSMSLRVLRQRPAPR
ncbi:uncharacterized protein KIAA1614 homolog isoform X2 [Sorex araneus]|uniref:uncharacterized protein KIAA1614 homolog isoform X2 n=1 Tax=Sorex araneus TaxID=42254 RepID=UPI00243377C8|nr:uncharacterized protein KIAA1614 homolog isoform X2 [Sorex araneus]